MTSTVVIHAHPAPPLNSVEVIVRDPEARGFNREQRFLLKPGAQHTIHVSGSQRVSITETFTQDIQPPAPIQQTSQAAAVTESGAWSNIPVGIHSLEVIKPGG